MAIGPAMIEQKGQMAANEANIGLSQQGRGDAMRAMGPQNLYKQGSWLFPGMMADPSEPIKAPPASMLGQIAQSRRAGAGPMPDFTPMVNPYPSPPPGEEPGRQRPQRQQRPKQRQPGQQRPRRGLAAGGPMQEGQSAIVGEQGPEVFEAPTDGQIVPNQATDPMAGGPPPPDAGGGMPGLPPQIMEFLQMLMSGKGVPAMQQGGQMQKGQQALVGEGGPEQFQMADTGGSQPQAEGFMDVLDPIGILDKPDIDIGNPARRQGQMGDVQTDVGPSAVPGEAFRTPGEAAVGSMMNLFTNPGQVSPINYERQQEQGNQALQGSTLAMQGGLTGQGIDPNSGFGQMLAQSAVSANQSLRNEAMRNLMQQEEATYRSDLGMATDMYTQFLNLITGLGQSQAQAATGSFTGVQNPSGGFTQAGAQAGQTAAGIAGAFGKGG